MMDQLYMTYFEETEELLQQAEDYLIRLESGCSSEDINGLFRVFHSIKGSSQMIGYDDIGNLTHKMEDMLDMVRKGQMDLDGQILQLCFSVLDHVKSMFEAKKYLNGDGNNKDFVHAAADFEEKIDEILKGHAETGSRTKNSFQEPKIVGALKEMERTGKNRYYVCVSFSDDIPMIAPVLFMIFNNIKEIGSLAYANVSDEDLYGASANTNLSSLLMIVDSDLEEAELYTYFDMTYVEKVAITDISEHQMMKKAMPYDRSSHRFFELFFQEYPKLHPVLFHDPIPFNNTERTAFIREQHKKMAGEMNRILLNPPGKKLKEEIDAFYELCLNQTDQQKALHDAYAEPLRKKYLELFELVYGYARGKCFYKIFQAKHGRFMERLSGFVERMDKSCTRKFLLDLSLLEMIHEHELRSLIEVKRRLNDTGIVLSVIINPRRKRIINIFDSIRTIEHFELFDTEVDAALGANILLR